MTPKRARASGGEFFPIRCWLLLLIFVSASHPFTGWTSMVTLSAFSLARACGPDTDTLPTFSRAPFHFDSCV